MSAFKTLAYDFLPWPARMTFPSLQAIEVVSNLRC